MVLSPAASAPLAQRFVRSAMFPAACFLALSAALYGNSLFGTYVYDDFVYVLQNALRNPVSFRAIWLENPLNVPHYRPLTFSTFALNFLLTGDSPLWFHAVSVVLNGLTSWFVFLLTARLFGSRPLAWSTALLFAVLPIHTEAVAYIKARDEILVAFFGLLAWIAFLRATNGTKRMVLYAAVSALLSLCAFLSKESALVLPGVFGGTLLIMHGRKGLARAYVPLLLQAAAIGVFFLLHRISFIGQPVPGAETLYFAQSPLGFMGPRYIPWTAAMLLFVAVGKTFVPWNLSATYGFAHLPPVSSLFGSWMVLPGLALLLGLLLLAAHPRTRRTPFGVGALVFLILYFPFSKIPLVHGIDFFGERWLYAPSIGLCMMGAYAFQLLARRQRNFAPAAALLVFAVYVAVIIPRNHVWKDMSALGESMVESAPRSAVSYDFLARERLQQGRVQEASGLVRKGLKITEKHLPLHQVAALVALDMGDIALADEAVTAAEQLGRNELSTVILRSTVLASQRRFQESLDHLLLCRTLNKYDQRVRFLLALNLWKLGRSEEAQEYFDWDAANAGGMLTQEQKIWLLESF